METQLKLFGAYNGQKQDFSYIRVSLERCKEETLNEVLGETETKCFSDAAFDYYFKAIRLELLISETYINLQSPTSDFFDVSQTTRVVSSS